MLHTSENYFDECGVNVIGRGDSNYGDVVANIASSLRYLTCEDPSIANAARRTATRASWANFIVYYEEAYCLALSKIKK